MKTVIVYGKAATWLIAVAAFLFLGLTCFGQVSLNPSNAFATATDGANYTGGIGLSMLTVSVLVGALLWGWKLKSRGR